MKEVIVRHISGNKLKIVKGLDKASFIDLSVFPSFKSTAELDKGMLMTKVEFDKWVQHSFF